MRVLIIEDDQPLIQDISFCLKVGYPELTVYSTAEEPGAINYIDNESPDLVILDSSLPDLDVLSFIRDAREYSAVPLVILGNSEDPIERARGLDAGADDYISRSFSPMELLARCKALLRRSRGQFSPPDRLVSLDGLAINFTTREVFLDGQPVRLSPLEYGLLSILVRNEGRLVTTRTLLDRVWGSEYPSDASLVKTCIYRLRSKLKSFENGSHHIINERGFGYRLAKSY